MPSIAWPTAIRHCRRPKALDYDLVVLDLSLPHMDGLDVLRELRSDRIAVPVLILTARDGLEDRIRGLDLGADDYLTKAL